MDEDAVSEIIICLQYVIYTVAWYNCGWMIEKIRFQLDLQALVVVQRIAGGVKSN